MSGRKCLTLKASFTLKTPYDMKWHVACFFLGLSMCAGSAFSQVVVEQVDSRRARFNPFLGQEEAFLHMELLKRYELGSADTTWLLRVNVEQATHKLVGRSWGATLFDKHIAWSTSKHYLILERSGEILLSRSAFDDIFRCANNVYQFIEEADRRQQRRPVTVSCEAGGITIGGSFDLRNPLEDPIHFYWKIGDEEARFLMSEQGFAKVVQDFRALILQWPSSEGVLLGSQ